MKEKDTNEIVEAIIETVQDQTGLTVDQIFLGEDRPENNILEALFVFTNGIRLNSRITVTTQNKQLAFRIQGNYI